MSEKRWIDSSFVPLPKYPGVKEQLDVVKRLKDELAEAEKEFSSLIKQAQDSCTHPDGFVDQVGFYNFEGGYTVRVGFICVHCSRVNPEETLPEKAPLFN